ncbi:MAG: thiamine phosphate synthase [Deltaproteobacteria bacterium CG11_big_fil_rev_8_21_14_0_20_49_13]|nr:MAG: thiamine phosphate synthase [Deltaproteobacteria bacterium CG11_big_fil_rev_8_21_14_0_20_49_13]
MNRISGLYGIVDTTFSPQYSHAELAHLMLLGGCQLIQLRMKPSDTNGSWSESVFKTAQKIMALKKEFDFTFIINDYIEVAGKLNADGVHVGPNDTPVKDVRRSLGDKFIIGYSSSKGLDLGLVAEKFGADYVAFGAIFPTKAKGPDHPVQGLERLRTFCSEIKKPVVAIGGINRSNIDDVIKCGVSSVAMIRGITEAKDIVSETKWYVNKFYSSSP